jgi:hypothetical protein
MDNDLIQLLIYVAIGLIGVIASAYKNRMKRQQAADRAQNTRVPRNLPADPERDFAPELGPLLEMFDIPRTRQIPAEYETVEGGPGVEEDGMKAESEAASVELAGLKMEEEGLSYEKEAREAVPEADSFEEGQSDIQKMIAKYEAIHRELDKDLIQDEIASGEIVSVETEELARARIARNRHFFDPRLAIIYSEILKRREY